jgi:hypothetical protein
MQSPCNPFVEDYAEVFYTIHKRDIPSVQYKMKFRWYKSKKEVHGPSFIFIDGLGLYLQNTYKDSVRTSQETHYVSTTPTG